MIIDKNKNLNNIYLLLCKKMTTRTDCLVLSIKEKEHFTKFDRLINCLLYMNQMKMYFFCMVKEHLQRYLIVLIYLFQSQDVVYVNIFNIYLITTIK